MKFEYDSEVDGLFIWFLDPEEEKNYDGDIWPSELKDEIGLMFTKNGGLLGIEVQPASKYFKKEVLLGNKS